MLRQRGLDIALVYYHILGLCRDSGKRNGNYYNGLYRDTGNQNGNCYSGLYRDNGKENGNYYSGLYRGMGKNMETTKGLCRFRV